MSPLNKKRSKPSSSSAPENAEPGFAAAIKIEDLKCPSLKMNVIDRLASESSLCPFFSLSSEAFCVPDNSKVDVFSLKTKKRVAQYDSETGSPIVSSGPIFSKNNQVCPP